MGNAAAMGWQFRGEVVVQSVLSDLVARHGLGHGSQKHTLIFGGGSAGARGAMVHLDYVSGMLGSVAPKVNVVGFLDSPAWIDMAPFRSSFIGFPSVTQHVHSYANVSHLGSSCIAKYANEPWKCMYGQYRLPTLSTPYFLVASQYDAFQLGVNVGHKPNSSAEKAYAEKFANRTRALVTMIKKDKPENAVFSWACYNHDISCNYFGYNRDTCDPSGTTMATAFHEFLGLSPTSSTPPLQFMDKCTTFACGGGCAWSLDSADMPSEEWRSGVNVTDARQGGEDDIATQSAALENMVVV